MRRAPELPRPTRRPMQSSRVGSALAASRKPSDKGTVARSGPKKRPTSTPAIPHRSKKVRARGNIVGYRESSGAESAFQMLQLLTLTSRYRPVRTICAKPLIAIPESLDSPNSFNYTPIRTGASTQPGRQLEGGSKVARGVYETGLDRNDTNFVPLSPLISRERAVSVWPDRTAVVHSEIRRSWAETFSRVRRLASALVRRGLRSQRHGRSACDQHAGAVRGPFRRAARRCGAERHQHPARCPCHYLTIAKPELLIVNREFSGDGGVSGSAGGNVL